MPDLTQWPTLTETAEILETSIRTLWRYNQRGKLEIRKRPVAGSRPATICNPVDIEKLKPSPYVAQTENTQTAIATRPHVNKATSKSVPLDVFLERLNALSQPAPASPAVAIDKKLWLTPDEGSAYSGLARSVLRRAANSGEIKARRDGPRRTLILQRASLEKYAK